MSTARTRAQQPEIVYPDSDGKPMSDNTLQFRWIVKIKEGLEDLFRDDPNVFIAGDLLWYPVEGDPKTRAAPDAMVAFGRPKGDRGSYMQWVEGGIAPQVVFEVLSPGNRDAERKRKLEFYQRFLVEEYYEYDPDEVVLKGWLRAGDRLVPIATPDGWTSPRLGIRFDLSSGEEMVVRRPDGTPFENPVEVSRSRDELREQLQESQKQTRESQKQARESQRQALESQRRAEMLAERLRAAGMDPDA